MVTTDAEIERAGRVLEAGGLVAFPTETVYGLGCDAGSVPALHRLFAVKRRPPEHPVIVHLAEAAWMSRWAATVPAFAAALATECWPGPLTLVVPRARGVLDEVTGGRDSVALRVPAQRVALRLLTSFGRGIAAPSANRFGKVSPTTAEHVRADLGGEVDVVLDDGPCGVGVESTIVDCSRPEPLLLRTGGVPVARVEEIVGMHVTMCTDGTIPAPGTLPSHYAPRARVVLADVSSVDACAMELLAAGERVGLLCQDVLPGLPEEVVRLEVPASPDAYARVLYARLREADLRGLDVVLAVPPPESGVGAAVVDRLRRAAGSRAWS